MAKHTTHDPNPFDCDEPDIPITISLNEGETVTCGTCGVTLAIVDDEPPPGPDVDPPVIELPIAPEGGGTDG